MIVVDGDAKYIRKFMIEISGLNSHMIDPPSEYGREVTVLLPNTEHLRGKFDSKKEAPITLLQDHPYFPFRLICNNSQKIKQRSNIIFHQLSAHLHSDKEANAVW